jgi:hypothetical protein
VVEEKHRLGRVRHTFHLELLKLPNGERAGAILEEANIDRGDNELARANRASCVLRKEFLCKRLSHKVYPLVIPLAWFCIEKGSAPLR